MLTHLRSIHIIFSDFYYQSYIKQIRKYHPDLNPSADAQEKSKLLNVAKEALETPEKKAKYDRRLYNHLNYKPKSRPVTRTRKRTTSATNMAERMRRSAAIKQRRKMGSYVNGLKHLPMTLRYIFWGAFSLIFYGILVSIISFDQTGWRVSLLALVGFYWFGIINLINEYYKYYNYLEQIKNQKSDYKIKSSKAYNYLFYGGLALILLLKLAVT